MFKKVLIAIDGSNHAAKAVVIGSDIAAKYDAEVVLLHVLLRNELLGDLRRMAEVERLTSGGERQLLTPPGLPSVNLDYLSAADGAFVSRDVLQAIGEWVLENAERTALNHDVRKIVKRMEDGKPVDRILDIAKSDNVDLIVTGARGLSDLKALILGSVSHKVSQLSPVTCMAVR